MRAGLGTPVHTPQCIAPRLTCAPPRRADGDAGCHAARLPTGAPSSVGPGSMLTPHRCDTCGTDAELCSAQVWQHTSLGNNDGHLPQEVATLPAPSTPPATLMSAETMKVAPKRFEAIAHVVSSFASLGLCSDDDPTVNVCRR